MADNKIAVYAVVGLVIGILVGAGAGYALFHSPASNDSDESYWFYINFGADNKDNGWYSGSGSDSVKGFDDAMKKADIKYEINKSGYISTINDSDGFWSLIGYTYEKTSVDAQNASILYPVDSYGYLKASNGWLAVAGYDSADGGFKLSQFNSNIYYLSMYNNGADKTTDNPVTDNSWMKSGPFATA